MYIYIYMYVCMYIYIYTRNDIMGLDLQQLGFMRIWFDGDMWIGISWNLIYNNGYIYIYLFVRIGFDEYMRGFQLKLW